MMSTFSLGTKKAGYELKEVVNTFQFFSALLLLSRSMRGEKIDCVLNFFRFVNKVKCIGKVGKFAQTSNAG